MKKVLFVLVLSWSTLAICSPASKLDTIYANQTMNTALFFPTDIRQGIVGSSNFTFTYNRERGQNLGLLKASKGADSNLLVITSDGRIYSFIIRYLEKVDMPIRFITTTESIGHEDKIISKEEESASAEHLEPQLQFSNLDSLTAGDIDEDCQMLLRLPERKNIYRERSGISLAIRNIVYQNSLLFLQLELTNQSGVDFIAAPLEVTKIIGYKGKKASFQQLPIKPIYRTAREENLSDGVKDRFVCVLPTITLAKGEKLSIDQKENRGTREVSLILNSISN